MTKWRWIARFKGLYQVSNRGEIKSVDRWVPNSRCLSGYQRVSEKILVPRQNEDGYWYCTLSKRGVNYTVKIHRAVAEAFIGPCPKGKMALHRDDDKDNNTPTNLYYGTSVDNLNDAFANGKIPLGSQSVQAKLTESIVLHMRKVVKQKTASTAQLAKRYGVTINCVQKAVSGASWKHV